MQGYLVQLGDDQLGIGDQIVDPVLEFNSTSALGAGSWTWTGVWDGNGQTYANIGDTGQFYLGDDGNVYFVPDTWFVSDITTATVASNPTFDDFESGSAASETITAAAEDDVIYGGTVGATTGTGNDSIFAGAGDDTVFAGDGADTVEGSGGSDSIDGGAGNDVIYGDQISTPTSQSESLNWTSFGANGTDFSGGFTQDTGTMAVTVAVETEAGYTTADISTSTIYDDGGPQSTTSSAYLGGSSASDVLTLNFTFNAEAGTGMTDEVENVQFLITDLDADGWTDIVTVRAYDYDGNEVAVVLNALGADTVNGNTVTASAARDQINEIGGSVQVSIAGPVHTLQIDYDNGATAGQLLHVSDIHFSTVVEVDGNDNIAGGAGADQIYGGGGEDTIDGGEGADTIEGNDGNDTIDGGDNSDIIYGGDGDDFIADSGSDLSADSIYGGAGNDTIEGGDSNDLIEGGTGNDSIDAGIGDDSVSGGVGNDTIGLGAGNDTFGDWGTDGGDDTIYGDAGSDSINGDTGNDVIYGGNDDDVLTGGAGNDILYGGQGSDWHSVSDDHNQTDVVGGEDGDNSDVDTLALYTYDANDGVTVNFTGAESGTYDYDGTAASGSFSEIEAIQTTDFDDSITGSTGDEIIYAGAGTDTVDLGGGDDYVDLGAVDGDVDTIRFSAGDGSDTVENFEIPTANGDGTFTGLDQIDITGMLTISGEQATTADVRVVSNVDGDAVLFFPNGESLTLIGVTPDQVDDPAVLFAMGIPQDGIVSGGATDDNINGSYIGDPDGDLIDNNDAILSGEVGNDDIVMAGAGNDIIRSEDGNDEIYADRTIADLIVNGSFEDLTGTVDTSWGDQGVGSVEGWTSVDPNGELDLHDNGKGGTYATDGTHVLDMGASPTNLSVYQDVSGVIDGETYVLSFDAGDMSYNPVNAVEVYWNGQLIDTVTPEGGTMQHYTYELIGGSGDGTNRLQFTEIGPADNDGVQLDQIQLIGATEVGAGDDTILSGSGNDLIYAGAGNDEIFNGNGSDTVYAEDGDDIVYASIGSDEIYGGAGNDEISAGGFAGAGDTMDGGAGNDTLISGLGDDTSFGGAGDDIFQTTGTGTDTVTGGETNETVGDILDASNATTSLTLDLSAVDANDNESGTLVGTETTTFTEIEAVELGSGDDSVTGSSAADTVDTGAGADTIDAGAGNDAINIGDQDGDADVITFSDGDGDDTIIGFDAPIDNGDGTFTGIDTFDVSGMQDADGNPVNVFDVTVGNDGSGNAVLNFPNGESVTLIGVDPTYAEQLSVLIAMGIPPSDGTVSGTAGNDLIDVNYLGDPDGDRVDNNDAILAGDTGNDDLIEAGAGNDTVIAGDGDDSIFAGSGDDTIFAGAGNDSIDVGGGSNVIYAGDGNDTVGGATSMSDSTIYGGDGDDFLSTPFGTSLDHEIYGGDGNDFIVDNGDANTEDLLDGGAGDDNILGGEGNDTIIGGSGNDTVDGFAGDDVFILEDGFGVDSIAGSEFAETTGDVLDATAMTQDATLTFSEQSGGTDPFGGPLPSIAAADLVEGTNNANITDVEQFNLGSGDDTVIDDGNDNSVDMGAGDDTWEMFDGFGNDTVVGGETGETVGDDIDGSGLTENVTVTFSGVEEGTVTNAGGDTLTFSEIEQVATGSGDDTIFGGIGDEVILTGAGDDDIDLGAGNDSVDAGAGNDEILGGAGADTVDGGADYDFMNYSASSAGVNVNLQDGLAESGGDAEGDVLSNIEQIDGSFFADDTIIGDDSGMLLKGWGGNDTLGGGTGNDRLEGGDDRDTFLINDDFGDDIIVGGQGGDNYDTLDLSNLTNPVSVSFSGPGAGTITDLVTGDTIVFSEIEQLILTNQDDVVDATNDAGYTYIQTLEGSDSVLGSSGDDVYDDEIGVGIVNDGAGNDTFFGGAGNDEIWAGNDDDTIFGGTGNDTINGQAGNDTLYGEAGNDTVDAGEGDDTIFGGDGTDELFGGSGNDTISASEGDTVDAGEGDDVINIENFPVAGDGTITIDGGAGSEVAGDTLDLTGVLETGSLNATDDGTGSFSGTARLLDGTTISFSEIENIICFTPGTMIATPKGARDIADLKVGDLVVTRDHGLRPIRWIQSRTVAAQDNFAPICIRPGVVVGQEEDLLVSPQHRMLFQGYRAELLFGESEVLVAAKHLIDGNAVTQEVGGSVTYIHMMFDQHEIVFAHGAATESFHPGIVGLDAVTDAAREELFQIFPDLRADFGGYGDTARKCLKAHEAQLLKM